MTSFWRVESPRNGLGLLHQIQKIGNTKSNLVTIDNGPVDSAMGTTSHSAHIFNTNMTYDFFGYQSLKINLETYDSKTHIISTDELKLITFHLKQKYLEGHAALLDRPTTKLFDLTPLCSGYVFL